jgi:enterochelin esterase-like enzyme
VEGRKSWTREGQRERNSTQTAEGMETPFGGLWKVCSTNEYVTCSSVLIFDSVLTREHRTVIFFNIEELKNEKCTLFLCSDEQIYTINQTKMSVASCFSV